MISLKAFAVPKAITAVENLFRMRISSHFQQKPFCFLLIGKGFVSFSKCQQTNLQF